MGAANRNRGEAGSASVSGKPRSHYRMNASATLCDRKLLPTLLSSSLHPGGEMWNLSPLLSRLFIASAQCKSFDAQRCYGLNTLDSK